MMRFLRAPGRVAGWVCLLAALLHALAFVVHTGRAAAAAPAGISAALAGALCARSEALDSDELNGGGDEERPALASGCPICTAGAAIVALPAPAGAEVAARRDCAASAMRSAIASFEPGPAWEATPIRGPPAALVTA